MAIVNGFNSVNMLTHRLFVATRSGKWSIIIRFFEKSRGKLEMTINVVPFLRGAGGFPFRARVRDGKNHGICQKTNYSCVILIT